MSDVVKIAIAVAVTAAVVVGILALVVATEISVALTAAYDGASGVWHLAPMQMLRFVVPASDSLALLASVVMAGFFIVGGAKVVLRVLSV